jgi:thioredoxin 1
MFFNKLPFMKQYYLAILCLFVAFGSAAGQHSTKVKFVTGATLRQVLTQAKESNKLVFIDFYANWCSPCSFMDETTFNDERLAMYVDKNFVAYKVDVEDFEGYNIKQQFNIKTLPTFLVLNSRGDVIGRYEESMGATKLQQELQKYELPANRVPKKTNVATVTPENTSPKNGTKTPPVLTRKAAAPPSSSNPKPVTPKVAPQKVVAPKIIAPKIVEPTEQTADNNDTPDPQLVAAEPETPPAAIAPTVAPARREVKMPTAFGEGLYEFNVKKHSARGYSVQTNALGQLAFVLREVEKMQKAFPDEPILVYISNQPGKTEPLYKIMVGSFDNEAAAEPIRAKLRTIGVPNPTTKNLATMK